MSNERSTAVALLVGLTWASVYPLTLLGADEWNPVTPLDYAGTLAWSARLLVLAPAAWFIARLSGPGRLGSASLIAVTVGAVIAGAANFVEDGLGWKSIGGTVYAAGLGVLLVGLVLLVVATLVRRRPVAAVLAATTLVGLFTSANGGQWIIPAAWLGTALWLGTERSGESVARS